MQTENFQKFNFNQNADFHARNLPSTYTGMYLKTVASFSILTVLLYFPKSKIYTQPIFIIILYKLLLEYNYQINV